MSIDVLVDLRERFGPARNQGARPTCMAFAASDTHSFAHGMTKYLSAEYAHYKAVLRRKPLNPNRGVPISLMINAIREDGQPPEDDWPYLTVIPSPLSAWVPPKNCARIFRHSMLRKKCRGVEHLLSSQRGKGAAARHPDHRAILLANDGSHHQDDTQRPRCCESCRCRCWTRKDRHGCPCSSTEQLGEILGRQWACLDHQGLLGKSPAGCGRSVQLIRRTT